jgi:hypothetical protein
VVGALDPLGLVVTGTSPGGGAELELLALEGALLAGLISLPVEALGPVLIDAMAGSCEGFGWGLP